MQYPKWTACRCGWTTENTDRAYIDYVLHSRKDQMTTLPCVVCDQALKSAIPESVSTNNQPYAGTTFTSHGQYGSTVFDDFTGNYLELNICDVCLVKASEKDQVLYRQPQPPPTPSSETWNYTEWKERY